MGKKNFSFLCVEVALVVFMLLSAPDALAVTFTVNSTLDQPDDLTIPGTCHTAANTCTLRAAIMQANRTKETATIILPAGLYKLTIPAAGSDGEENGDLNLTPPTLSTSFINIIGAGAGTTIIDAGQIGRILSVARGRSAAIGGVTIRNGKAVEGGGIFNNGELTVSDAVISNNQATYAGGGIFSTDVLTVINSTIRQNFAYDSGGGIRNLSTSTVIDSTISYNTTRTDGAAKLFSDAGDNGGGISNNGNILVTGSTISQNSSNFGGGIFQAGGTFTVVNSTVSQNRAMTDGGGLYNFFGSTNVYNASIVFNDADSDRDENGGIGGGVFNMAPFPIPGLKPPVVNLRNTLMAGNTLHDAPIYDDCYGNIGLYGSNLFSAVGAGCTFDGDWGTFGHWDPLSGSLGPLQNNGGPTWTHALMPGNNAIGGSDVFGCVNYDGKPLATDQRGVARPQGFFCDIGSYEYNANAGPNPVLYFPHIATSVPWQTEIAVINTSYETVIGTLRALSNSGEPVDTKDVTLPPHGRRQITVADEFVNHTNIGYIIFDSSSHTVQGYTKFHMEGGDRTAIPAVKEVNGPEIYIPHIASDSQWWTGISLVNTTSAPKNLTITFNNGQIKQITLNAHEHRAFDIASLFDGRPQPDILSAVISDSGGIIGLEIFGNTVGGSQIDGILLTSKPAFTLYYPHVADGEWWTGIVAYNPSVYEGTMTVTPYSTRGIPLTPSTLPILGKGKYIGAVAALGLPTETAWFKIDCTRPLSGFELFGTVDDNQLAPYAGGSGTGAKAGVFAKIEKNGWTGIAFVNTEDSAATVTLTAYNDNGVGVATNVLHVGSNAKVVKAAEAIFSKDTSTATYIAYSSDRNVIGFELNGSLDGTMLDGLPGM